MFGRIVRLLMSPFRFILARKGGLPLLIIIVVITINYALLATRDELEVETQPERIWPVNVVRAEHRDVQPEINLFGEVVAGRRSELQALVDGVIVEVGENFREGGAVKKGELLIQIDLFDYETALTEAQWKLKEAEARLEQLRRDFVRAKDLYTQKNVSEEFLDNAELAVVQQEAIVGQRVVGVQRAEHEVADARLVAPYDGVVINVNANLGNSVSGFSDKVADLIDTSQLEARFSLSNAQYGRLIDNGDTAIGREVQVSWQVGDRSLVYDATIKRVGGEIVSTTGGVDAYAVIDTGGEQTDLRPGAFVSVRLPDMLFENILEAPDTALYGEDIVYIVGEDRLRERRIRIRGYSGTNVLFSSAGDPPIRDGDLIVTTQLREGGAGVKVVVR